MSVSLSDRLDAALAALRDAGCTSMVLTADVQAFETIFRERGDLAILFDADKAVEIAWYAGDCEVRAATAPVPVLSYARGDQAFRLALDETTPALPPGTEAATAAEAPGPDPMTPAADSPAPGEAPSARAAA